MAWLVRHDRRLHPPSAGSESRQSKAFHAIEYGPGSFPLTPPPGYWDRKRAEHLESALAALASVVESIEAEVRLEPSEAPHTGAGSTRPDAPSRRVFLVHGHHEGLREGAARYLEKLGLEVIILAEQPNRGMTIIEKVERYSDVSYAVVLLTGDDRGGTKDTPYEKQRLRARQNVIAELGYFVGKLGRGHVAALLEGDLEIPSDFAGVVYISVADHWKLSLAREIDAAGIEIDLNLAK